MDVPVGTVVVLTAVLIPVGSAESRDRDGWLEARADAILCKLDERHPSQ